MMDLTDEIDEFLKGKGISEGTARTQKSILLTFNKWLALMPDKGIREAGRAYRSALDERTGLKPKTVRTQASLVEDFSAIARRSSRTTPSWTWTPPPSTGTRDPTGFRLPSDRRPTIARLDSDSAPTAARRSGKRRFAVGRGSRLFRRGRPASPSSSSR